MIEVSRRDDMIAMAYTIIFLSHKGLPWFDAIQNEQGVNTYTTLQSNIFAVIKEMKEQLMPDKSFSPFEN